MTTTKTTTSTKAGSIGWRNDVMQRNWRNWPVKLCGPKPTLAEIETAGRDLRQHYTGKHLGLAMYLRPAGATQVEVAIATRDTQVNAYRDALLAGYGQRNVDGRAGHKAYALALPKPKAARKRKADTKVNGKPTGKRPRKAPTAAPVNEPGAEQA